MASSNKIPKLSPTDKFAALKKKRMTKAEVKPAETVNKKKEKSTSIDADNDEGFSTDWDIDYYRTEYESEEHWELRRSFMEAHKQKFPEQRLVCLAQVFTNMELMGCRYPAETMHLVAEMSKDLAQDYREKRETRLKRTFVTASDAAEQRAKGRRTAQQQHQQKKTQQTQRQKFDKQPTMDRLFEGLPFGKFVLYLLGGRNCLLMSAQRSKMQYKEVELAMDDGCKVDIYLDDLYVASGKKTNSKLAKAEAFTQALLVLQKNCYSIKRNPLGDKIKIDKTPDNQVVCGVLKQQEEKRLDENNKGYQMMKLMGWSGGGLGSRTQGAEDPVGYLFKNNRAGLGNKTCELNREYFLQMLDNYVKSDDIRELRFESSFTKEQRAMLHEIAGKFSLKSNSYGKADQRHLIISKKTISNQQILNEVLLHQNPSYCDQYFVQVPATKATSFPLHTTVLELSDLT